MFLTEVGEFGSRETPTHHPPTNPPPEIAREPMGKDGEFAIQCSEATLVEAEEKNGKKSSPFSSRLLKRYAEKLW